MDIGLPGVQWELASSAICSKPTIRFYDYSVGSSPTPQPNQLWEWLWESYGAAVMSAWSVEAPVHEQPLKW